MKHMYVQVTYRDEKKEVFDCVSFPEPYGDFLLLHLVDFKKEMLPKDGIARVTYWFA